MTPQGPELWPAHALPADDREESGEPDQHDLDRLETVLELLGGGATHEAARRLSVGDWRIVTELLVTSGVAGYVYHRHSQVGGRLVPEDVADALRPYFDSNRYCNTILLQEAARVVAALQEVGGDPIVLKGIALLATCYKDPGSRRVGDIDLLVRPDALPGLDEVMAGLGYVSCTRRDGREVHDYTRSVGARFIRVDVSTELVHRSQQGVGAVSYDDLVKHSRSLALGSVTTMCLGPCDMTLHVLGHVAFHHDMRFLRGFVDLLELLSLADAVSYDELLTRADELRIRRALTTVVGMLGEMFPGAPHVPSVPGYRALRTAALRSPAVVFFDRAWLVGAPRSAAVSGKHGGVALNLARFYLNSLLFDRARDRVAYVMGHLKPTRERVAKTYGEMPLWMTGAVQVVHPVLALGLLLMCAATGPLFAQRQRSAVGWRLLGEAP